MKMEGGATFRTMLSSVMTTLGRNNLLEDNPFSRESISATNDTIAEFATCDYLGPFFE
jgi:hypothetical protein